MELYVAVSGLQSTELELQVRLQLRAVAIPAAAIKQVGQRGRTGGLDEVTRLTAGKKLKAQ